MGERAPDFTEFLLDGGPFSLNESRNKKIVVLYFWTTFHEPYLFHIPLVARIVEKYKTRDVELYCLDRWVGPVKIRDFLKKKRLNLNVCINAGSVYSAYAVYFPTLVVIDKSGVVRSVRKVMSSKAGQRLRQDLEEVLAGDDAQAGKSTAE